MKSARFSSPAHSTHRRNAGVVLLALLLALALGAIGLMAAADVWVVERQRERERELMFVGEQYRQAIVRYYYAAPPGAKRMLPSSLEDLLEDDRYPMPVRHLRRLYRDPITGQDEWGIVRVGERIAGVHSLSEKQPVKQVGFGLAHAHFEGKAAYTAWTFVTTVAGQPLPRPAAGALPGVPGLPALPTRPDQRTPL